MMQSYAYERRTKYYDKNRVYICMMRMFSYFLSSFSPTETRPLILVASGADDNSLSLVVMEDPVCGKTHLPLRDCLSFRVLGKCRLLHAHHSLISGINIVFMVAFVLTWLLITTIRRPEEQGRELFMCFR